MAEQARSSQARQAALNDHPSDQPTDPAGKAHPSFPLEMPLFPVIWLALGLALLALEGLGAEFDGLLAAAVAALALSALSALVPLPLGLQVLLFGGGTGLLVLALQRWGRRRERAIPASAAAEQATVISGFQADGAAEASAAGSPAALAGSEGRVRWQGQSWAATNLEPQRPLQPGQPVQVMGRDGNRLQVLAPPEA